MKKGLCRWGWKYFKYFFVSCSVCKMLKYLAASTKHDESLKYFQEMRNCYLVNDMKIIFFRKSTQKYNQVLFNVLASLLKKLLFPLFTLQCSNGSNCKLINWLLFDKNNCYRYDLNVGDIKCRSIQSLVHLETPGKTMIVKLQEGPKVFLSSFR